MDAKMFTLVLEELLARQSVNKSFDQKRIIGHIQHLTPTWLKLAPYVLDDRLRLWQVIIGGKECHAINTLWLHGKAFFDIIVNQCHVVLLDPLANVTRVEAMIGLQCLSENAMHRADATPYIYHNVGALSIEHASNALKRLIL